MNKVELTYRGSLKSCNYKCPYCPFSKSKSSKFELEKDQLELIEFFKNVDIKKRNRIFIVPYGEALIHKYYRDEIEKNLMKTNIEAIGIQTNLSLDIISWIKELNKKNIPMEKLHLWITCHFNQINYDEFILKIKKIHCDISISVGVVGIPEDYEKILKLRKDIPKEVYLWINEYSQLKREYRDIEIEKFQRIDPIFNRKKEIDMSKLCSCGENNYFVEGDGKVRFCNRNPKILGRFEKNNYIHKNNCQKKTCDCYLSFSKFSSDIFNFFGDKKLYRIPEKKVIENIFFDIDGTIVINGSIDKNIKETMAYLYEKGYNLYFITDLPFEIAMKKCRDIKKYFKGGIFDCGAHISMEDIEIYETFNIDTQEFHNKILKTYKKDNNFYKILLKKLDINIQNISLFKGIPNIIVKEGVNKYSALKKISTILKMDINKILVVGNGINDIILFKNIKNSICVFNGNTKAKKVSKYILNIDQIPFILKNKKRL